MAKRTLTKYVHDPESLSDTKFNYCSSCVKVKMEWDDGLPEPSKCPHDWPEAMGCSECLKLNKSPKTRERRVEGFVGESMIPESFISAPLNNPMKEWIRATLIIHEPVKEMTLEEACETVIAKSATVQDTFRLSPIIEALAREKAKKSS
jgi:hypothetical protein